MFALLVAGTREAGPKVSAFADGKRYPASFDVAQRPSLFDELDRPPVLAQRPEIGQPQQVAVVRPILEHELRPARGVRC
jgi:hypothetical protein